MKTFLLTLVACALAFLAGRLVPRSETLAPANEGRAQSPSGFDPAGPNRIVRHPAPRPVPPRLNTAEESEHTVLGREIAPEWAAAVRRDPKAATAVHQAVLRELEARRRSAENIWSCFDPASIGLLAIRFTVPVRSSRDRLHIGSPSFLHVAEGTPVSAETSRCLEKELSGTLEIGTSGEAFLDGYSGPVEYEARFHFAGRD